MPFQTTGLNLQLIQLTVALWGCFGPVLSGFLCFSKVSTCLQYAGDSRQHESKEVIYVTLQDGLNFLAGMRLVDSSASGLPMDHLGSIACDS